MPVIAPPAPGPLTGISPSAPIAPGPPTTSGNPLGNSAAQPGVNPVSPPIGAGGAGVGTLGNGQGWPAQSSGNAGPATIGDLQNRYLGGPPQVGQGGQSPLERAKELLNGPSSWLPPAPRPGDRTPIPPNPNQNLAPGQSPTPAPGRQPNQRSVPRPGAPTIGSAGQYLRVFFGSRTWDGVDTGVSQRGGDGPFGGFAYEQSSTGQRKLGLQFNGYVEWFGLDPTPGANGENYNSSQYLVKVTPWLEPDSPLPQNRTPGPQVIPPPATPAPAPLSPPPYNDPKPFRRPTAPPNPNPVPRPDQNPTQPPREPNPTQPPREPDPDRRVPPPLSPPSPAPTRPGPTTTPDPLTPVRPSPAPRPTPTPRPGIDPQRGPSTVPNQPPAPAPLAPPRTQPLPSAPPVQVPLTTPARTVPLNPPVTAPGVTPPLPPMKPPGPTVAPGEPSSFDRYGVPGSPFPTFPNPVPPIALPPNLDCCDTNSIKDYLEKLKDYLAKRLDDLEDCACPVTANTVTTELVSSTNNGNYQLPEHTVAVRFRVVTHDLKMRSEWGGGDALDVNYVGWYSTSKFNFFGGKRTQIQYSSQVVEVGPGHRYVSVTAKGSTQLAVDAVHLTGFSDSKGLSVGSVTSGAERLYRA